MADITPAELAELDDQALSRETEQRIYNSALMAGSRWASDYYRLVDEAYDECKKRSRGIYQRAWNAAAQGSCRPNPIDPKGV